MLRYEDLLKAQPLAAGADPRLDATIDLDIQREVTTLARRYLAIWRGQGAEQAAVIVVERGTGAVLADLGSSDYADSHAGALDFTQVQRSPGSTLKPFIYALALDRGVIKPSDILPDLPEGASGVSNADGHFLGPMLPRQALANSRNVPAINLIRSVGLETSFRFLRGLGLHDLDAPADSFGAAMAIGALPTTLERLARAYGALADDGWLDDLAWFEGQARAARAAPRVVGRFGAAHDLLSVRSACAAAEFSALWPDRISLPRRRQDRHLAGLSRRLYAGLFAPFSCRRLDRAGRRRPDDAIERREFRRAARQRHHDAAA